MLPQPALIPVDDVSPAELPDPLAERAGEIDMSKLTSRACRRLERTAWGTYAVMVPVPAPGHPGMYGHVRVGHVREERVSPKRFVAFLATGPELGWWANQRDAVTAVEVFARRLAPPRSLTDVADRENQAPASPVRRRR